MSYEALDESVQDGQPVELFKFENIEDSFFYTSGENAVLFDGDNYIPVALSRTEPTRENLQATESMTLQMPSSDAFVRRYVLTTPATQDRLTIFQFHSTDTPTPEVIVFFSGSVATVSHAGGLATVSLVPNGVVLRKTIPRQTCRSLCNHFLFDGRCQVNKGQFSINGLISGISVDGRAITVSCGTNIVPDTGLQMSAQLATDSSFFDLGIIARGGVELKMIEIAADLTGNTVLLNLNVPFQTIQINDSVSLAAGCDHQAPTCISKFDNIPRFGGFPFVPGKNPFVDGVDK